MSSGGGGTNTVEQQSAPPAQYLNAYSNVTNQAQNVAGTPYQNYPGQIVAGLSPDQLAGIQATEQSYGAANPYINSAANYIQQSQAPVMTPQVQGMINGATNGSVANAANAGAQGITNAANSFQPSQIAQWESPYTQQVVNATQAQFANQNAQEQSALGGNAASQAALGGDRTGVAQGIAAGQEQLAQAPVIANLENQGYQTALGAAQSQAQLGLQGATAAGQLGETGAAQQASLGLQGAGTELGANEAQGWLASQGGYGMANLGNEALTSGLTGANALLGIGGLEQSQAQQELNVPYEQFLAQQAYPFQTTGWEANIDEGLGGASGGTSSTTYPSPSIASQIGGAGAAGIGLLGTTGAFGPAGYLTGAGGLFGGTSGALSTANLEGLIAAGGGIDAGAAAAGAAGAEGGALALASARGGRIPHRASAGSVPQLPTNNSTVTVGSNGIPQLSTSGYGGLTGTSGMTANPQSVQAYLAQQQAGAYTPPANPAPAAPAPAASAGPTPSQILGMQNPGAQWNAVAGMTQPQWSALQQSDPVTYSALQGIIDPAANGNILAGTFSGGNGGGSRDGGRIPHRDDGGEIAPYLDLAAYNQVMQSVNSGNSRNGGGIQHRDDGGMTTDGPTAQSAPPSGMQPPASYMPNPSGDPWQALMDVGLGIMGGGSPFASENIGKGALEGLKLYQQQRQSQAELGERAGQMAESKARTEQINWNTEHNKAIVKALQDAQTSEGAPPIASPGSQGQTPAEQPILSDDAKEIRLGQIAQRESGAQNIPNKQGPNGTPLSTASGYYQMLDGTWQEGAKLAGIQNPPDRAMQASYADQHAAARALFDKYGETPWAESSGTGHSGGIQVAGPGGGTNQPQVAPMFNVSNLAQQATMLMKAGQQSGDTGLISAGQKLLQSATGLADKGVYLGTDGQIHTWPGYAESQASIAGAKSKAQAEGEAPTKIIENLAYRAAQPVVVKPGEVTTTGFEALPPDVQQAIKSQIGVQGGNGGTQVQQTPQQPQRSGYTPERSPMPGVPNPTTDPGMTPPASGMMANPDVTRSPNGALVTTLPPAAKAMQDHVAQYVSQAPHEIQTLREAQSRLVSMQQEIIENSHGPQFLQSGFAGQTRTDFANAVNTTAQSLGLGPVFDPDAVANNQAFTKNSSTAAFALARSMAGGRVALGEVLQANRGTPNLENSVYGNLVVGNLLTQENQRQIERGRYMYSQASNGSDPQAAADKFDQANPPWKYVPVALASAFTQRWPQSAAFVKQNAQNAQFIKQFDASYGQGVAEQIIAGDQ